jgi:hypothetical protein
MAEFVDWDARVNLLPQLTDGQWTTITLSPPDGATVAMLRFIGTTVNNQSRAGTCRRIGDTTYTDLDRRLGYNLGGGYSPAAHASIHCAELTNDQIEVYYSGAVDEVYVVGWLASYDLQMFDGVPLQDYIVEPPVTGTWLNLDVSALQGGSDASALLVSSTLPSGTPQALQFRTSESGSVRNFSVDGNHCMVGPVPLVNGACQVAINGDINRRIMIRGLFGDGFVAPSVAQQIAPASGTAWFNFSSADAPTDTVGVLYHFQQSSSVAAQIQAPGQDESQNFGINLNANGHVFPVSGRSMRAFASAAWPRPIVSGWFTGTLTAPTIGKVNDDNTIVNNGPIVVDGTFNEPITQVDIDGHELTIIDAESERTNCAPFDIHATALDYGPHTLTVRNALDESASIAITTKPPTDSQYVTGASVDTVYGLAQEGGADGDQWETVDNIAGSNVVLSDDTNLLITPAAIDGASRNYWRYSGGTWVQSSYIINGSGQGFEIWGFAAVTNAVGEVTLKGITGTLSGTVYGVVDASPTQPTKEQVRDGLNAAGAPALGKGSAAVTTADLSVTITGLPSDTLLYGWLAQWV